MVCDITFNGALQPKESGRHADTFTKNCAPEERPVTARFNAFDDLSMVHTLQRIGVFQKFFQSYLERPPFEHIYSFL